jgi:hypothetical protein
MKFFITLFISLLLVAIVARYLYGGQEGYDMYNLSNGFFAVGLPLFFGSLIVLSGAKKIFITMGYTFKNLFTGAREKYSEFYDYSRDKQEEDDSSVFGFNSLIISIIYLIIAAYLGFQVI